MTDNTQELDEIIAIFQDHAASNGYPMNDEHKRGAEIHKQSILDWHNKQVEAVLDRLHVATVRGDIINGEPAYMAITRAIEAERNKLKEKRVNDDQ